MTSSAGSAANALGLGSAQTQVTDWFKAQLLAALSDPLFNVPKTFETWVVDRVAVAGLSVPIGQIVGFSGFTVQEAPLVPTSQTTTSTVYTNLATAGPTVSGLSAGRYVIQFGAAAAAGASGELAFIAPSVNTGGSSDGDAAVSGTLTVTAISRTVVKDLTLPNNQVTLAYRHSANTSAATFASRWMILIKTSNL